MNMKYLQKIKKFLKLIVGSKFKTNDRGLYK